MKKLFLFAAILFGTQVANAQISEGNVMVGTTIANFNANFGTNTALSLSPKAAWFIEDGLAVGLYGNFGFDHRNNANTTYSYGLGPLARYFLQSEKVGNLKKAKFFLEANAGFEGQSRTRINDIRGTGSSTNGLGFGAGPGVSYFITPNVGLEALIKYNGIVGFGSSNYTDNLSIGIGFQIYLPGKKTYNAVKQNM